jgi:hypothetical protein
MESSRPTSFFGASKNCGAQRESFPCVPQFGVKEPYQTAGLPEGFYFTNFLPSEGCPKGEVVGVFAYEE